jgi:antibiotic biosynthesis monooxygenase (ABM) superfamily enzyme
MSNADPITVWIVRTVKSGREPEFERAMHEFAKRSLELPGQLGIHVIRPATGSGSRDYRMVRKFASRAALQAFRDSQEYAQWNQHVHELTEGVARFEELTGLESWFTPPGAEIRPLPRWKMAIVTFLGVYPLTSILPGIFMSLLPGWHPLHVNVVVTGLIVASLTWLIMPLLTRLLRRWLNAT